MSDDTMSRVAITQASIDRAIAGAHELSENIAVLLAEAAALRARAQVAAGWDLVDHLVRQRAFSLRTFGPGARTSGIVDHIRKELDEIQRSPADLEEWVDVILLAFDGAWRLPGSDDAVGRAHGARARGGDQVASCT